MKAFRSRNCIEFFFSATDNNFSVSLLECNKMITLIFFIWIKGEINTFFFLWIVVIVGDDFNWISVVVVVFVIFNGFHLVAFHLLPRRTRYWTLGLGTVKKLQKSNYLLFLSFVMIIFQNQISFLLFVIIIFQNQISRYQTYWYFFLLYC